MPLPNDLVAELTKLQEAAPAGFALAFHIHYTRPTFLFQTYPAAWINVYSEKGLVMSDPTVHWGFENEGTRRWSDLVDQDANGVLEMAATYGMNYGVACAVEHDNMRSMASFARSDREFNDAESVMLFEAIDTIHHLTTGLPSLSPKQLSDLTKLGIQASQPGGQ